MNFQPTCHFDKSESIVFMMSDVARLIHSFSHHQIGWGSLSLARVLMCAASNQGIRQVDIAQQLAMQPVSIARFVDQLVRIGVIERKTDPADRRAYRLFLREDSDGKLESLEKILSKIGLTALRGMGTEEVSMLVSALVKIRQNLDGVKCEEGVAHLE